MYRLLLVLLTAAITALVTAHLTRPTPLTPVDVEMARLLFWIAERTDYSLPVVLPRAQFLPREQINRVHDASTEVGYRGQSNIVALYEDRRHLITLPTTFDLTQNADTLVHELVHHLQNVHGRRFRCLAEREREAYLIQVRFVAETGIGTMPSRAVIERLRCQKLGGRWPPSSLTSRPRAALSCEMDRPYGNRMDGMRHVRPLHIPSDLARDRAAEPAHRSTG